MANPQIIGADKTYALDKLNQWLRGKERTIGPVIAIGDGGADTAVTFDLDQDNLKSRFARLKLRVGANCIVGGNEILVCEGEAYVSGVLQKVCVTRSKP